MRIVQQPSDFLEALATTRREAQASFANSDMILEKYISNPRHIEIQILADQQGHCLYLFERDCSIQRRHQKVIEEAPAPHLLPALRQAMGQTAIAAANAIHYEGAGTIEFLYDSEQHFYFMEMNTRLQVEHPVTECITGQDLVKLQIEIAMGYPLSLQQSDLHIQGHAIEARIYAENPHNHFLPSTGTIHYLQEPQQSRHVRIDSGIATGSHISMHYDPMLAKLIVWDETRKAAIKRLQRTLNAYQLVGLHTNITYLNKIISHPDFIAGKVNTHFIQNHEQSLLELPPVDNNLLALISFFYAKYTAQKQQQRNSNDQTSPWLQQQAWRANHACNHTVTFTLNDNAYHIPICYQKQQLQITLDGKQSVIHGHIDAHGKVNIEYQQQRLQATCQLVTQTLYIFTSYGQYRAQLIAENDFSASVITTGNHLHAPMPGAIIAINTTVDAQVKAGDALIVMEAMKMEHTIYAPNDGQIAEIFYPVGAQVMEGAELITLATTTTKNDLFPANHESFNKTSDNTLDKH
jgi:3-methylcrotonyl-CoA carboxylase alpha subunit